MSKPSPRSPRYPRLVFQTLVQKRLHWLMKASRRGNEACTNPRWMRSWTVSGCALWWSAGESCIRMLDMRCREYSLSTHLGLREGTLNARTFLTQATARAYWRRASSANPKNAKNTIPQTIGDHRVSSSPTAAVEFILHSRAGNRWT